MGGSNQIAKPALKAARSLAVTTEFERLFHDGIVRGKKENLNGFTAHASCLYLKSWPVVCKEPGTISEGKTMSTKL